MSKADVDLLIAMMFLAASLVAPTGAKSLFAAALSVAWLVAYHFARKAEKP